MKRDINNYPGSKGGSGVRQVLFNCIPETDVFVEGFSGSGKIGIELKKSNRKIAVILCEKSQNIVDQLEKVNFSGIFVKHIDTIEYYSDQFYRRGIEDFFGNVFFFDPPYLFETRKSQRKIYDHEWSESDHKHFLRFITNYFHYPNDNTRNQMFCIITHPRCELYETELEGWYTKDIEYMTRNGSMTDTIWMNYDITQLKLANTNYIGSNYKERQAFNRKKQRWSKRLNGMPLHEKQALVEHLASEVKV